MAPNTASSLRRIRNKGTAVPFAMDRCAQYTRLVKLLRVRWSAAHVGSHGVRKSRLSWRNVAQLRKSPWTGGRRVIRSVSLRTFLRDRSTRPYVVENIKKNQVLTKKNIKRIRPGLGLNPIYYEKILGKKVNKNIKFGTPLKLQDIL